MTTEEQIERYAKLYAEALNRTFRNQAAFWTDEAVRVAIKDGVDPKITIESYGKLSDDIEGDVMPIAMESAKDGAGEMSEKFGGEINTGNFREEKSASLLLNISTQAAASLALILPFASTKKSPAKIVRASLGLNRLQTSGVINKYQKLAGLSGDKVAARDALKQIKRARLRRLGTYSQNEIVTAYTSGQDEHFKGLPGIKFKTWVTKVDELTCPICRSLHLQEVPIHEMFLSSKGYIDRPTAHPNCRCQLRYRILK